MQDLGRNQKSFFMILFVIQLCVTYTTNVLDTNYLELLLNIICNTYIYHLRVTFTYHLCIYFCCTICDLNSNNY